MGVVVDSLPIAACKKELIKEICSNKVTIVVGETGSGKTTQIPQYLSKTKLAGKGKMIGVTQPRRVAAISLAQRVSQEMGTVLGNECGYAVRFDNKTNFKTRIKYMTDGLLLKEYVSRNSSFAGYSCIILDEAHERTLRTDILFGLVKRELEKRPNDFKVVIMSATLDADSFSEFFNSAPVLYVRGRQYPVRIMHSLSPQHDPVEAALISIVQIHREYPLQDGGGDVLVFLTGQEEIESCEKTLMDVCKYLPPLAPGMFICPIYAALSLEKQQLVFSPTPRGMRKIVLSTNIAETSITIPGISYVVDTGLVKQRNHHFKNGLDTLAVTPISQASANQRAGRAGREGPGICFRLYQDASFAQLEKTTQPEIQRCNMATVLLVLLASGIKDVLNFDYMDPPPRESIQSGLSALYQLGALDTKGEITSLGRNMARFPLEPAYARVLIASAEYGCTKEIARILACLSTFETGLFINREDARLKVNEIMSRYRNFDGDHIVMYNLISAFVKETRKRKGATTAAMSPEEWCRENCVRLKSMRQVLQVEQQILEICKDAELVAKNDELDSVRHQSSELRNVENVIKTLLKGFFMNIATRQTDGSYKTLSNQIVHVHPSSIIFSSRRKADILLFNELVQTRKKYMRNVCIVQPDWLAPAAPHVFNSSVGIE